MAVDGASSLTLHDQEPQDVETADIERGENVVARRKKWHVKPNLDCLKR